jgi:hypothetical protein
VTSYLRPPPKRPPPAFTLAPGRLAGRPAVVVNFGRRHGQIALDADDVDRFVAALEAALRAAKELGEK